MKPLGKILVAAALMVVSMAAASAQNFTISGKITSRDTGDPIDFATILIETTGQWAMADAKGEYTIKNVNAGKIVIEVSCLGYVTDKKEITISKSISYNISLREDNLALESAVITAKEDANSATTSRTIDKTALDHVQIMNVADIGSLLPGGSTVNPSLVSEQTFSIRGESTGEGNSSFGTAVEVDGVRLSNNASFTGASSTLGTSLKGASTNNIASSNVESVEVITGVPSVEYGDMTSGVVKVSTRKGKTPWTVTFSTNPTTKQVSASKGFSLGTTGKGSSAGVINASAEYTRSFSDLMSPYTAYDRKQLSLTYSNQFTRGSLSDMPLRLTIGMTGNLGGLDDRADPDKYMENFTKTRDNQLRGNVELFWLLNKSWITNIEFKASAVYGDKLSRERKNYDSAKSKSAIHALSNGYYMSLPYVENGSNEVVQIAPGYWYNTMCTDDKPLTAKLSLKADWSHKFGSVTNKVKLGGEWTLDKNFGIGAYSEDESLAPTYRTYRYCDHPAMSNAAAYLEDNLLIPVGSDGRINLIAGLRTDNTIIPGSVYGVTSSLSPRFNGKYTVFSEKGRRNKFVKQLSFRASWGVAVKQPSYAILYPAPSYYDEEVFTSTVAAGNTMYSCWYTVPQTLKYNSALRWQKARQAEVGMDMTLGGTKISLAAFYTKTIDSYFLAKSYDAISYYKTNSGDAAASQIAAENRLYNVDPKTGVITITDKTGARAPYTMPNTRVDRFLIGTTPANQNNDIHRYGLEWVLEFPRITPVNTTIRLDGNWYNYKGLTTDMLLDCPASSMGADGTPYKYVGCYYGDSDSANGQSRTNVKTNLTFTTNIPKVRMIFSVKFETSLIKTTNYLSERADGSKRSYVLNDRSDNLSVNTDASIYDGDNYSVLYPDLYYTFDDPTMRPFLADYKAARAAYEAEAAQGIKNGPAAQKYFDMGKLVQPCTTYSYYFKPDRISPYFCVNVSVTKEIGKWASLSFYANNFFNNNAQLMSSRSGQYVSVTSYIPAFYYGLTMRFKF